MKDARHPLSNHPEEQVVDYLSIVAVIATADGEVSDSEISRLRELCTTIEISPAGRAKVIAAAEDPSSLDTEAIVKRLVDTELKFSLITDMFFIAHADGQHLSQEHEEIKRLAALLTVSEEQLAAIEKYVQVVLKAQNSGERTEDLKEAGVEVAAGLAATGIPIAAVAVSGSVFGLSAAGITSGLAALGMGLGMVSGIGVVAALGIGSYLGVRYLYKKMGGAKNE